LASALQLTATNTVANGYGLAANTSILSQITKLQSQSTVVSFVSLSTLAATGDLNVANAMANIGLGVKYGQWLLDLYPSNCAAVSTGGVYLYTGNIASFSNTLKNQVTGPFASGLGGFANVYNNSYAYMVSSFDTVASANILQGKTYAQSGIGYSGPADLATGGIGNSAAVLSNVVSNFGTMYDINNISTIGDPYVFGQNILNQNLGQYGNLANQLSSAGLDITNLQAIPTATTTTNLQSTASSTNTPIGAVSIPSLTTTTTTTSVPGNSLDTVTAIYETITGSNLDIITSTTGVVVKNQNNISSLNDYLNLNNIVDKANLSQLNRLGISTLNNLGTYIHNKIGNGNFSSWPAMATFLQSLEIPTLAHTTANANGLALPSSISSSITSGSGGGTGPFGNPVLTDFLGATTGYPYSNNLAIINKYFASIAASINLSSYITALRTAINNYINSGNNSSYIAGMNTAVTNLNTALKSLSTSTVGLAQSESAYYQILNKLSTEVTFLSRANAVFGAGYSTSLSSFSQSVVSAASDKTQYQTYQFFANLITNDQYGDTIRAAVAETINTGLMAAAGITLGNDPAPATIISQAQAQNQPISTYLSQNK
jgi:hypothetical protein